MTDMRSQDKFMLNSEQEPLVLCQERKQKMARECCDIFPLNVFFSFLYMVTCDMETHTNCIGGAHVPHAVKYL